MNVIKDKSPREQDISNWEEFFAHHRFNLYSDAFRQRRFIQSIIRFVPDGGSILEAGFGAGRTSLLLADLGYQVTAIDIDSKLVDELATKGKGFPNLAVRQADMFAQPFKDNTFSAVISQGVLEHFPEEQIRQAISEQKRVSKDLVIFDVPNNRSKIPVNLRGTEMDFTQRSHKAWKQLIADCGLSIEMEYRKSFNNAVIDSPALNLLYHWYGKRLGSESGFVCRKDRLINA